MDRSMQGPMLWLVLSTLILDSVALGPISTGGQVMRREATPNQDNSRSLEIFPRGGKMDASRPLPELAEVESARNVKLDPFAGVPYAVQAAMRASGPVATDQVADSITPPPAADDVTPPPSPDEDASSASALSNDVPNAKASDEPAQETGSRVEDLLPQVASQTSGASASAAPALSTDPAGPVASTASVASSAGPPLKSSKAAAGLASGASGSADSGSATHEASSGEAGANSENLSAEGAYTAVTAADAVRRSLTEQGLEEQAASVAQQAASAAKQGMDKLEESATMARKAAQLWQGAAQEALKQGQVAETQQSQAMSKKTS